MTSKIIKINVPVHIHSVITEQENMKYLFLSSSDSTHIYPNNSPFDFIVEFPQTLELNGNWLCALTEINYTNAEEELYVYCDICEYSYVCNGFKPLLRVINGSNIFETLYYIPVNQQAVKRIHVYIRDREGQIPSFNTSDLRCTLALKHGK